MDTIKFALLAIATIFTLLFTAFTFVHASDSDYEYNKYSKKCDKKVKIIKTEKRLNRKLTELELFFNEY